MRFIRLWSGKVDNAIWGCIVKERRAVSGRAIWFLKNCAAFKADPLFLDDIFGNAVVEMGLPKREARFDNFFKVVKSRLGGHNTISCNQIL